MKWKFNDEEIESTIGELDERIVMVERKYIENLEKHNIPYSTFSESAKMCFIVRRGKKKKRFNEEECKKIKDDYLINGKSYRKLSKEYECSTRIIYQILKDKY